MISLAEAWRGAVAPPDRRATREWGGEFVEMPAVLARHGKFDTSESRHFEAPLDCIDADANRETSILAPPRSGKSLIADVATASLKARESAAVLRIFIDDKLAKSHAELRQNPIIDACAPLARMLPGRANRNQDRTMETIFTDGLPLTVAGPALSNLQQRGYKVVNLDECWNYASGVMANARARMGDFVRLRNNKFICISQGGEEECDWALHWKTAVLYEWHVPCLGCGKLLIPRWNAWREDRSRWGMLFEAERRPDGGYDEAAAIASLRFECFFCRHEHRDTEATRAQWNRGGRYLVADAPDDQGGGAPQGREPPAEWPEHAGFHWNNLIDFPWRELVRAWLVAQQAKHVGVFTPLVTFFQKQLAQMRSERSIFAVSQPFARMKVKASAEPRAKTFAEAAFRFVSADRQSEDVYWVTIRDWAADGSGVSQRVYFGKVYSDVAIEELVAKFGAGYWEAAEGGGDQGSVSSDQDGDGEAGAAEVFVDDPSCVVVDSGYRPKGDQGVYSFCARRGWIALKGADDPFFWHHETDPENPKGPKRRIARPFAVATEADPFEGDMEGRQGQTFCTLVRFSSPVMKDLVRSMIAAGVWNEPEGPDDTDLEREYRVQMAAEFKRPRVNKFTGKREDVYVCPSGNNHAFDCSAMQVFCAMQAGALPAGGEERRAEGGGRRTGDE